MAVTVESATLSSELYDFISNIITSPLLLILVGLVLIAMTIKSSSSSTGSSTGSTSSTGVLETILIAVFLFLVLINGVLYFFGVDITTTLSDFFTNNPKINVNVTDLGIRSEVFHIPGNHYVYHDEVEESYKKGGEWCSYGWSEGQMALFPTQKDTWNNLQSKEGHENDCGRPGINGGFIDNPAVRFGANCYGVKPRMTETEKELMEEEQNREEKIIDERADFYKDKLSNVLVSPFNSDKWNGYRRI